jgi:hypothetical protein
MKGGIVEILRFPQFIFSLAISYRFASFVIFNDSRGIIQRILGSEHILHKEEEEERKNQ